MTRVLLTAGYDRALHVVGLADLLRRANIQVAGIVVVSAWNWSRLQSLRRSRGPGFLKQAWRKWRGSFQSGAPSPLETYLAANGIPRIGLRRWCAQYAVPYRVVQDLNAPSSIHWLEEQSFDAIIYGGGGILRQAFLSFGPVINAHMASLPEIRGMNALEWSLLLGVPPFVTIHLIDSGIDTGAVIERIPFETMAGNLDDLRSHGVVIGIGGLLRAAHNLGSIRALPAPAPSQPSRQCFTLAPVMKDLLLRKRSW